MLYSCAHMTTVGVTGLIPRIVTMRQPVNTTYESDKDCVKISSGDDTSILVRIGPWDVRLSSSGDRWARRNLH